MVELLRWIIVCEGISLLIVDFFAFVYRKVTEGIGIGWAFFGCVMILLGSVPGLSGWARVVPKEAVPALGVIDVAFVIGAFYLSVKVSVLLRKNQELAMHVSLINQENERILEELKKLREQVDEQG